MPGAVAGCASSPRPGGGTRGGVRDLPSRGCLRGPCWRGLGLLARPARPSWARVPLESTPRELSWLRCRLRSGCERGECERRGGLVCRRRGGEVLGAPEARVGARSRLSGGVVLGAPEARVGARSRVSGGVVLGAPEARVGAQSRLGRGPLCASAAWESAAALAGASQAWRNQHASPYLQVFPLLKCQHRSPLGARRACSAGGVGLPLPLPLPLPLGSWAGALG